jgi:hypothetical protein
MTRVYEAKAQHIGNIQDALIIKYMGLDNSEEHQGDARFRQRHLATIQEFCPTDLLPSPYGIDGTYLSQNEELGTQGARMAIAQRPWDFLIALRRVEYPATEEIIRYIQTIQDLATEFGLRPKKPDDAWWGYDRLHDAVGLAMNLSKDIGNDSSGRTWWAGKSWGEFTPSQEFIPSPWERNPWTDKKATKARLLEEFEDHWKEGDRLMESAGYTIYAEREMVNHIHWLFLAICPDSELGRPLTYQEIADRESTSEDGMDTSTITKAVLRLAKLLDIDLRKSRGRQRKL